MAKGPSPQLGYNTNVRHKGKLYHIQTEDSGVERPHIITHLFADGGRIVSSKKSTYAQHVGTEEYPGIVKKMMQEQHKGMFIALRDGVYDDPEPASTEAKTAPDAKAVVAPQDADSAKTAQDLPAQRPIPSAAPKAAPALDIEALERAAAQHSAEAKTRAPSMRPPVPSHAPERAGTGRYQATRPAKPTPPPTDSIFGNQIVSEKSLDEVILGYLAEDLDEQ